MRQIREMLRLHYEVPKRYRARPVPLPRHRGQLPAPVCRGRQHVAAGPRRHGYTIDGSGCTSATQDAPRCRRSPTGPPFIRSCVVSTSRCSCCRPSTKRPIPRACRVASYRSTTVVRLVLRTVAAIGLVGLAGACGAPSPAASSGWSPAVMQWTRSTAQRHLVNPPEGDAT